MADTQTRHFPTFRAGDAVLFEIEVRNRTESDAPRYDPPGGVTITILQDGTTATAVADAPMARVSRGLFQYQWDSPLTPGRYTIALVALTALVSQQSQIYAAVKLVA